MASQVREMKKVVANKYQIDKWLGAGAFGEVFLANDLQTGDEFAIKMEPLKEKHKLLEGEAKIYERLNGGIGIPRMFYYGKEGDHRCLVMELLGSSLKDLFNFCGRRFSEKTVLLLADQMLERIAYVHGKGYLHRDIKPENFMVGRGVHSNQLFLADFGLGKSYIDPLTGQHIKCQENKRLTGTARYCTINTHLGIQQSRRDDLEMIGYVLIYFLRGELPWQNQKAATKKEIIEMVKEKKLETSVETLCHGLSPAFATYLNYCRNLGFAEEPDYGRMRKLFSDLLLYRKYTNERFDWNEVTKEAAGEASSAKTGGVSVDVQPSHTGIDSSDYTYN